MNGDINILKILLNHFHPISYGEFWTPLMRDYHQIYDCQSRSIAAAIYFGQPRLVALLITFHEAHHKHDCIPFATWLRHAVAANNMEALNVIHAFKKRGDESTLKNESVFRYACEMDKDKATRFLLVNNYITANH